VFTSTPSSHKQLVIHRTTIICQAVYANIKALVNAYKCEITEKSHFSVVNGYKKSYKYIFVIEHQS